MIFAPSSGSQLSLLQGAQLSPESSLWLALLLALALLPFFLALVTSFAKFAIVGGLLRQALGTPHVPPNSVVTGIALLLSVFVMAPVAEKAYLGYRTEVGDDPSLTSGERLAAGWRATESELSTFLERHANETDRTLFAGISERLRTASEAPPIDPEDEQLARTRRLLTELAPAFLLSELSEAFQIAFLLFLPFLVIDLVVSNVLLALGMHMLSPTAIALPLKLLLFVAVDGWRLLFTGLLGGYTG